MRKALFLALMLVACSCSSEPVSAPAAPDDVLVPAPMHVEPGQDLTVCSYLRAKNTDPVDVSAFITDQAPGGHHIVVYTVDHAIDLAPHACTQGGSPGWNTVAISQKQHEEVRFPNGVGYRLEPNQQFVIETHFINASNTPVDAQSTVAIEYAPAGSVMQKAGTFYYGTMNINAQPNSAFSASGTCSPPEPLHIRTMLGHQHRMGTGVSVSLIPSGGAPQEIYTSTSWENAPLKTWDEGLVVMPGDKLRVDCDWNNTSGELLRYPDEMCFAIGYQWPAPEASYTCFSGGGSDECVCFERGGLDVGPGGGKADVVVQRAADLPGAGADLSRPHPVYCFFWHPEDLGPAGPLPVARPHYFRDAHGKALASANDAITIPVVDMTPGTYAVTCMADLIGGGFVVGPGDIVSSTPALLTVDGETTATATVLLDFVAP